MITFKNIAGNKFLAVGTIQRKSALNGEKSLTGTLYDGKDVLNKIDKGWSLEFDGEPYVVTYFERNDNDNSVSFDAIHKFFWDMTKKVLYSSTEISGSHTIKWYLDQIFANTGYTYALNFSPAAIEKDNWGNKTRLSLFNDLITSIAGEFEINGTLISIFQNIGTDLSTIVRYGFNLSDMTIENDATSFVTYGEGFGAYADQQNQTGDRVHATYTSPLASVYGILQAEPIDDQRYTSQSNLQAAVKAQVDASFSVSVQLSLYDLTAAGYPYKMANVGDWLTAVDENLDFKQRIRIISIDDEFSADGTRISYTVTAGDVGLTKKYQDANASMASQIANAVASASQAVTDANNALISANGKNTSYYLNSVDDLPTKANEGDLAWVKRGDGTVMYIYTKKADGSYYWEKRIDPEMGDQISAGVTDAVAQANAHTDEVKQGLSSDIDTAKSQAASQASTAEANAKSAATSQFNQAQSALSAAKTDLTNSIASEASARSTAVAAVNSQAQTYANQAKADALNAVSKEVTDRQNAVSALDTKATNAVNQAKSDITDTINALSVGGRNLLIGTNSNYKSSLNPGNGSYTTQYVAFDKGYKYNFSYTKASTNWAVYMFSGLQKDKFNPNTDYVLSFMANVSTDIIPGVLFANDASQHNFVKQVTTPTILSSNGDQKVVIQLRTNSTIPDESDQSLYINGFVNKVGTFSIWDLKIETGVIPTDWTPAPEDVVLDYTTKDNEIKTTITQYQTTNDGKVTKAQTDATTALGLVATKVSQTDYDTKTGDLTTKYTTVKQTVDSQATDIVDIKDTASSQASKINSISSDVDGTKQSISDIETTQDSQSEKINQITSDVNGTKQSITDIQTKNGDQDTRMGTIETSVSGVKSDFSTYRTDANGRISTAQTTAQTAVDGLKTKVSQTDYNTKTGQLQTDLTTTTQTANQAKTDIVSIKETDGRQDARMTQIESDASGVKTTVSDLQTAQGKQSGDISTLQQRADGFDATVTKVDNLSVGGRNLLIGTNSNAKSSLNPGNGSYTTQYVAFDKGYKYNFSYTKASTNWAVYMFSGLQKDKFNPNTDYVLSFMANVSTDIIPGVLFANDASQHNFVKQVTTPTILSSNGDQKVVIQLRTNSTIPDESDQSLYINGFVNKVGTFSIWDLKIETGDIATDWTPAPEDVDSATAKAQLTADQATLSINNYKTDADGRIRKAQADIVTNANAITQKVSQTDYNAKTGDLTTAVTKAQTTADGVVTTVGNYQTSNDTRVKSAESAIAQNAKDITLRATTSDLNSAKSDLNSSIAQVKITADSISNFVRDSSGNISSDFQTALSKTSIITGSTLATSIQTQTSSQITQALTDNNGKIISLINQDTSGVQIAGKNIVLNGDTTVTGAFRVSQANIANGAIGTAQIGDAAITSAKIAEIDAGKITTGVLNSITANSMTLNAGTINGAAIYVTSMQNQIDGSTQNVRLGINPNWQHQLHIEPVSQSSGWHHYLYAGNDHLFLGAWDGSNSNTFDNRVALFTEGGSSEIDVGTIRMRSSGSAIYDDGWGSIDGVTSISMKGSDASYTSMYVGVGNNGTGEFRVVTNATIGTSNLNYADARAAHWYTSSLAKYKTNISEMVEGSALEMINRAGIYKYQFKTDVEADNDKYTFGPVIGDDYLNNPVEFLDSIQEGTDDHSASWITMKALQEEDSKVEALIARIEELEEKLESVGK